LSLIIKEGIFIKGQTAIEMIVILAVGLIFITSMIMIDQDVMKTFSVRLNSAKAKAVVNELGEAADTVYRQGVGSLTVVFITMPPGVNKVDIIGNRLEINYSTPGGDNFVYRTFSFPVMGGVDILDGNYWVKVESMDGYVRIGYLPPWYDSLGADDTNPETEDFVTFYSRWEDDNGLYEYIFSWSAGGAGCNTWVNDTSASFQVDGWTNTTKEIPDECEGLDVNYMFYGSDIEGFQNQTVTGTINVESD
jgi:hypothetical protein